MAPRGGHQSSRSDKGNMSPIPSLIRSASTNPLSTSPSYTHFHEQRDSPTYRSEGRSRPPSLKRDSSRDRSGWRDSGGRSAHRNSRANEHSNYQQRS